MFGGCDAAKGAVVALEELEVPFMRGRRDCNHKVINVEENYALGNARMEGG